MIFFFLVRNIPASACICGWVQVRRLKSTDCDGQEEPEESLEEGEDDHEAQKMLGEMYHDRKVLARVLYLSVRCRYIKCMYLYMFPPRLLLSLSAFACPLLQVEAVIVSVFERGMCVCLYVYALCPVAIRPLSLSSLPFSELVPPSSFAAGSRVESMELARTCC
jgi:hypothetical protein